MSVLSAVRAQDRPPHLKRAFIVSTWRGILRAQSWPRKRPVRPTAYLKSIQDRLRTLTLFQKQLIGREVIPMREAIEEQNRTHRGFKASAAIRARDIEVQRLSGRLFGFIEPDGKVIYSFAAYQDISDTLDWLCRQPGALLTRGNCWWGGALACKPGNWFTIAADPDSQNCCDADYPFSCG